jgi:hypothetical protein
MKTSPKAGLVAITFAIAGLWAAGCASTNVDPDVAKPGLGYVDFYCKDPSVMWNVKDVTTANSKRLFSKPKPVESGVLRMAFAPGTYKLEVSFLNRVVSEPGVVELQIQDRQVLPVEAYMVPAGSTLIREKSISGGATVYGRYGRTTKVTNEGANLFRVELTPQAPIAYAKKDQMSYAARTQP